MQIITREEARDKSLKRYFTGIACSSGHVSERYTRNSTCAKCASVASLKRFNKKSPDEKLKIFKDRYAKDPTRANKYVSAYFKANPDKKNAYTAKRKAAKCKATPPWANLDDILSFYEEAARLTAKTGMAHHVDHIVPLQGKTVCGLHVANNLQVLPAKENQSKSNIYWPDMWR